jgi:hypothetical protein
VGIRFWEYIFQADKEKAIFRIYLKDIIPIIISGQQKCFLYLENFNRTVLLKLVTLMGDKPANTNHACLIPPIELCRNLSPHWPDGSIPNPLPILHTAFIG